MKIDPEIESKRIEERNTTKSHASRPSRLCSWANRITQFEDQNLELKLKTNKIEDWK